MPVICIGLGGNQGDVAATFADALADLGRNRDIQILRVSRRYSTAPVGLQAGAPFLNAAATAETTLEPLALLQRLLQVESAYGRRREIHWGPRTLDLDLLLYGNEQIAHPLLNVPHPALWQRRFVLDPLAEIAPDALHPSSGLTIAALRARLLPRPLPVGIRADAPLAAAIRARLIDEFGDALTFVEPPTTHAHSQTPRPAFTLTHGHATSTLRDQATPFLIPLDASPTMDPQQTAVEAARAVLDVPAPAAAPCPVGA